jgi:hypothetical protein
MKRHKPETGITGSSSDASLRPGSCSFPSGQGPRPWSDRRRHTWTDRLEKAVPRIGNGDCDWARGVLAEVSQLEWYEAAPAGASLGRLSNASLQPPTGIGTQSDLISSVAEQTMADLIALAVPTNHRFTHCFVSTNSYRVVCGSPCAVLTVNARPERGLGQ